MCFLIENKYSNFSAFNVDDVHSWRSSHNSGKIYHKKKSRLLYRTQYLSFGSISKLRYLRLSLSSTTIQGSSRRNNAQRKLALPSFDWNLRTHPDSQFCVNLADWSKLGSTIGLCEFLSRPIVGYNVNTLDTQRSHVNAMYIRIKKVSKDRDTVYNRMRLTRVWKPVKNQILTSIKKHKFSFSQVLYIVP